MSVQISAGSHGCDGTVRGSGDHLADPLAAAITGNKEAGGFGQAILGSVEIAPGIGLCQMSKGAVAGL